MENKWTDEQKRKQIQLVIDGLEGNWYLNGVSDNTQKIRFDKPASIDEKGSLTIWQLPVKEADRIVQYEILMDDVGNVYMDMFVKTSGEKRQYRLQIDFLNSYIGDLYLIEGDIKMYYVREKPRTAETNQQ
ncbi:hypothetical protein [Ferruginibacter sp.]|nr:hypothetical protein [Ferruginibacter sp.]